MLPTVLLFPLGVTVVVRVRDSLRHSQPFPYRDRPLRRIQLLVRRTSKRRHRRAYHTPPHRDSRHHTNNLTYLRPICLIDLVRPFLTQPARSPSHSDRRPSNG